MQKELSQRHITSFPRQLGNISDVIYNENLVDDEVCKPAPSKKCRNSGSKSGGALQVEFCECPGI
jgi:hypothetical protein